VLNRVTFKATFVAVCTMLSMSAYAMADSPKQVDIPAGELSVALLRLAKQYGADLVYRPEQVYGLKTHGAHGQLTTEQAVTRLLQGTQLELRSDSSGAMLIAPPLVESTHGANVPPASNDAPISSDGSQEGKKNTSSDFRVDRENQRLAQSTSTVGSAGQMSANDPTASTALAEIVVTAQKREERLIDTPQSVSVLSSDDLNRIGALQFRDFANTVPGLSFTTVGAGFTQVSLRGVTAGQDISSTVAIYVDDVPYGSSSAFAQGGQVALDVGLFDVDRIEVLRGPQGTLYGASTMGGLIKYVTKRPDASNTSVDIRSGVSDTQNGGVSYDGSMAVNAPIVADKAAVRASVFYSHDGGYIDNVALGQNDVNRSGIYGARLDFLLTPNDALTIRIGGFLQDISRDGQSTADYTLGGVPLYGSLDQHRLFAEPFTQHFRLVDGVITYDFEAATLTAVSSYQTSRTDIFYDLSAIEAQGQIFSLGPYSAVGLPQGLSTNKFTQEVRLASKTAGVLEWLVGGFYTHESSQNTQAFTLRDLAGEPAQNDFFTQLYSSTLKEYAAFGDVTYHITKKFDVAGGIRYAHNDQTYTQTGSGAFAVNTPTLGSGQGVATYLANARYHFDENTTGYLRFATGYRPGGPNFIVIDPVTSLPSGPKTFGADHLKSYEAGVKAQTADRRFSIDLDGYYIDWTNIQINATNADGFGFIENAPGGATVRGAELTLTARPFGGFLASAAFAYQDAHLSQADSNLGGAKGERLPEVPHVTAAVNADYEIWSGALKPTVGATVRYVSDRKASFDNSPGFPQYRLPAYAAVDLRNSYVLAPVTLQLYVRNLFDARGQLSADASRGPAEVSILQPRTFGVTATMHF
jgi:iron complex outermembrane receptor protein